MSALIRFWVFLFGFILPGLAQNYSIRSYSIRNGLAQNWINFITQDSQGFLWICTTEGISRFDGKNFFNITSEHGLHASRIQSLVEDSLRGFLIGTYGDGLNYLWFDSLGNPHCQGLTLRHGNEEVREVYSIIKDQAGWYWLLTEHGLLRLRLQQPLSIDSIVAYPNVPRSIVAGHFIDMDGFCWLTYRLDREVLVYKISIKNQSIDTVVHWRNILPPPVTQGVVMDKDRVIWVSWGNGIYRFPITAPSKIIHYSLKKELGTDNVTPVLDANGNVWLTSDRGLARITTDKTTKLQLQLYNKGDLHTLITAFFEDREGVIWLGTVDGLFKLMRHRIVNVPFPQGTPKIMFGSLFKALEQGLLYCWTTTLLSLSERGEGSYGWHDWSKFLKPYGLNVRCIKQMLDGTFLMGSRSGLFKWRPGRLPEAVPLGEHRKGFVSWIDQDRSGLIWISLVEADTNFGIVIMDVRKDKHEIKFFGREIGLPDDIMTLVCDPNANAAWLGSFRHGLYRLELNDTQQPRLTRYSEQDGLPEDRIRALFLDSKNRLWIGTRQRGAAMFENGRFTYHTAKGGLPDVPVWSITEDSLGAIWMASGKGAIRFDGERFIILTSKDGLLEDQTLSCATDNDGFVWFSTLKGLSRIDPPTILSRSSVPPQPYFQKIFVTGNEVSLFGNQEFGHTESNILFEFGAIHYTNPDDIRFRYELQGIPGVKSSLVTETFVRFVSLAPGEYRFLVWAEDASGTRSPMPLEWALVIHPPLWWRWWFLTLCIVILGVAIGGFHRLRVKRLLEIERMRSRIATDLHDDIGADLTQIAIFSEVLKTKTGDKDIHGMLEKIGTTARKTIDGLREIVWYIDPKHDRVVNVIERLQQFASDLLRTKTIDFTTNIDPAIGAIQLTPELKQQLFLMAKEALHNAVRHADCRHITLSMIKEDQQIILQIEDDGKGISKTTDRYGHGLINMEHRAKELGGKFKISSEVGRGTDVRFEIPLSYRKTTNLSC